MLSKDQLPRHPIPGYVMCIATFLIPAVVAVVNYIMVISDGFLLHWKLSKTQEMTTSLGLVAGTAVLLGVSSLYGLVASALVSFIAPICAGSGIPEILSFLNGNDVPGGKQWLVRSFVVRVAAMVLAQAAGLPIGREGPMVAIGGTVGFGVAWLLLRPQEKNWDRIIASPDHCTGDINLCSTALVVNEQRFAHVKRIGCALGGAAGIATAFNAPIGGILYMFEELAVSSLPPDLAKLMCTVVAFLAARGLRHATNMDVHQLVIYGESAANSHGAWEWMDVPLFVALSLVLGGCGALFAKLLLATWRIRRRMATRFSNFPPWAKIAECTAYCALCSLAWGLVPYFFDCRQKLVQSAEDHLDYVRHTCPEGSYNEVASYFLSGSEGAIKHLYSQAGDARSCGPLAASLFVYWMLACGMPGLSCPMGTFVPSMLIGALAGRLFGESLQLHVSHTHVAPAGVYAVVGSAAVLAGVTHMTVGIVALLAEAIGDFSLVAPLMLAVFVAQAASKLISHFGYDEHLIMMKGIPFLDPEITTEMEAEGLVAADIADVLPDEALLPPRATAKAVKRALRQRRVKYFPIISEGSICVGLTTRGRLRAALEATSTNGSKRRLTDRRSSITSNNSTNSDTSSIPSSGSADEEELPAEYCYKPSQGHLQDAQVEAKLNEFIRVMFAPPKQSVEDGDCAKDAHHLLPLECIMDSAPHAILEEMPVSRFYNFFSKTNANAAIVVSKRGRFRGILTRTCLIEAQARLYSHHSTAAASSAGSHVSSKPDVVLPDHHLSFNRGVSAASSCELPIRHDSHTSFDTNQSNDSIASAVAGNMRPKELQEELMIAWRRVASEESQQDSLRERLRMSEERVRELELQLFGIKDLPREPPADGGDPRLGSSLTLTQGMEVRVTI